MINYDQYDSHLHYKLSINGIEYGTVHHSTLQGMHYLAVHQTA